MVLLFGRPHPENALHAFVFLRADPCMTMNKNVIIIIKN